MYLVLSSSSDPSGLWVYQGLRQLGVVSVELVLAEWLTYGSRWEYRVRGSDTHFKITLPDSRVVCSTKIRGAINRLLGPAPGIADLAAASDKEYAHAELQAFFLGWLKALPGVVINRPSAVGLCGPWYHASDWACRAARAGLAVPIYRQSARDSAEPGVYSLAPSGTQPIHLLAFRGEVFGAEVPESVADSCGRLAQDANTELLGVELYCDSKHWFFASASPFPDLSIGGTALLQRLAQALQEGLPA